MTRKEIQEKLQLIFREVFDDDAIMLSDAMTARDIEEWDSLMHIQLIISIEKGFNVKFKTSEVLGAQNVGEFTDLLSSKLNM